ncbi:MAG: response regulator [Bacteroidota bacterium]
MIEQTPLSGSKGILDTLTKPSPASPPSKSNTEKILIVEDSSVIQNVLKSVLKFQQYEVATAKDGREALKQCHENPEPFKMILMDLAMPILNGIKCLKEIRALKDPAKANVPIIAVTGNAEAYTTKEFLQAGVYALHEKPIEFDGLSKTIREYLDF